MKNRITISEIKKAVSYMPNQTTVRIGKKDSEVTFIVKYSINIEEVMLAVANIVNSCFVGEDDRFTPEVEHFAFLNELVTRYTNINLPENMDSRYELLLKLKADEYILPFVNKEQIAAIKNAVKDQIAYKNMIRESVIERQLGDIYAVIEGVQNQMDSMYSGITSDDISKLIKMMHSTSIDQEEFMKTLLRARKDVKTDEDSREQK